jgi:hypothetical protein
VNEFVQPWQTFTANNFGKETRFEMVEIEADYYFHWRVS